MSTKPVVILILSFFLFTISLSVTTEINLKGTALSLTNFPNVESKCGNLSLIDPMVLLQMIDAGGSIPNGIMAGNFFSLGNFDECYNIESNTDAGPIYGKYCLSMPAPQLPQTLGLKQLNTTRRKSINLHPEPRLPGLGEEYVGFHIGVCVPSWCSAEEISGLLHFTEDFCYSKDTAPELSGGAIATIVVLSLFLLIIAASTIYDVVLFYTDGKTRHELLIAFSFLTNGRKLLSTTKNPDQLLCLNGIKAISMMWVILGHIYSNATSAPVSNFQDVALWQQDVANMVISGATVSVDTFFTVGGLVTVYAFLRACDKGVKFNIFLFYLHRYLRLTPALAILALIHLYLIQYFGIGPLWKIVDLILVDTCESEWWTTLLYIGNYVNMEFCIPQTWYLQVDMQLFILSPFILIPLLKWPKIGLGMLGTLTITGIIIPFTLGYINELDAFLTGRNPDTSKIYYIQTYARFGPYVIGMILGYIIYKIKKSEAKLKLNWMIVAALWVISLTGLVACVMAGYDLWIATTYDKVANSLYLGFNRPAWSVALSMLIFLCVSDYGGPVNTFLSLPIFQFLTKLSYSMYLVHYTVIKLRYAAAQENFRFSNMSIMHSFWGDFMFTLALSVVLCLAFESPIIVLEKYLFGRGRPAAVKTVGNKPDT